MRRFCIGLLAMLLCAGVFARANGLELTQVNLSLFELCGEDEFLARIETETPVSVSIRIDNQRFPVATYRDEATARAVLEALSAIEVPYETNEVVTDSYHAVYFEMADGEEYAFSFNGENFERKGRYYRLENDDDFWSLCYSLAEAEYERQAQSGTPLFEFYEDEAVRAFAERFYEDPPTRAVAFMDGWDKTTITFDDPDDIAALFEATKEIAVEAPVDVYYTDCYNTITFTQSDGAELVFCFDRYNLELPGACCYALSGDEALWKLLRSAM